MQLCFYEDEKLTNFHPLTLSRPLDDLRIGIFTIAEKWSRALKADSPFARTLRLNLNGTFDGGTINAADSCLWINPRYLPDGALLDELENLNMGTCLQSGDDIIAAHADGQTSQQWMKEGNPDFSNLLVVQSQGFECLEHLWDLIRLNGREIEQDYQHARQVRDGSISLDASLLNEKKITICEGAEVEAQTVLDARNGPIYIGPGATVMAGSVLRGPVAVCQNAIIKAGAQINKETTVGPVCKVGGEVENTIFHSYSNKAHKGYIGHSVVGQWCNFGSGTTVSNLKTNYSNVRVPDWQSGQEYDSGEQIIGIMMGDHTKTAINCVINSGTVTGICCNILSRDFPPKLIRSFSWVGSNVIQPYKLDKALIAMEKRMARRDVSLTDAYRKMMSHISQQRHQES